VQLAQILLPRMTGFSVLNPRGDVLWSNDIAGMDEGMSRKVASALQGVRFDPKMPGELITTPQGDAEYVFWLCHDLDGPRQGAAFAAACIRCQPGSDGENRPFGTISTLVRPAIDCLRRELLAQHEILALQSAVAQHGNDLEMLLDVGNPAPAASQDSDDLKNIIAGAARYLAAGLAVLIVPEKSLVLVHTRPEGSLETGLVAKAHRHILSVVQKHRGAVIENAIRLQPGADAPVYRILSSPVLRSDGTTIGVLALFRSAGKAEFTTRHTQLSELVARRVSNIIAGNYDPLTNLLTRGALERRVFTLLSSAKGRSTTWSALYLDVNRLHLVNDTHGMHVGDTVLAQIGELIRQRLPPGALAGRVSGDRFALLLSANIETAAEFAESLRKGAEQLAVYADKMLVPVSVSIGVAPIDPALPEFADAYASAETACSAANDRGRNRVEIFQRSDESLMRRYTDISTVGELRRAISEGRMLLNAQPLAPLGMQHRVPHYEILLRMIDGDGQTVGPDHFLSAATRYQLMPDIDRWVISHALEMLAPLAQQLAREPAIFTINISGQSLQDSDLAQLIASLTASHGIDPKLLCFELTESAAVGNLAKAEVMMRKLRDLGCGVALDDFGTGLSSLAYLRSLPISMLKIDGSFVRDIVKDPKAASMIEAVVYIARSLNLVTVAEYVETNEIRHRVAAVGVDYAQGFAISRPVPLGEVLAQLDGHTVQPCAVAV
jgi:diguanylate cyclase (GGDEF)-like protein